jgi:hypothetical protein
LLEILLLASSCSIWQRPNFGARHLCRFSVALQNNIEAGLSPRSLVKLGHSPPFRSGFIWRRCVLCRQKPRPSTLTERRYIGLAEVSPHF